MKKRTNKLWRLNVVVIYDDHLVATRSRFVILELLRNLAVLYKFDYAISEDHQFATETLSEQNPGVVDVVYFRSYEGSRIDKKDFRSVIDCMFQKAPSMFIERVEVGIQLYRFLPACPFPSDFYRPLNYPYIEVHKGFRKSLHIYAAVLEEVIEKEQDFRQN